MNTAYAHIRTLSFVVDDDGILGFALYADADGVTVLRVSDIDDNVLETFGYDYADLTPLDAFAAGEYEVDADYTGRLLRAAAAQWTPPAPKARLSAWAYTRDMKDR
jgi:hypothetical protein